MDKNYYEILEVDKNASSEIIDKAYKTLVKKYHPDLQKQDDKKQTGEILKALNEAYETLSNPTKKVLYDQNLKNKTISQEEFDKLYEENQLLKNTIKKLENLNSNYIHYIQNRNNIINNNINSHMHNSTHNNQNFTIRNKTQKLEYEQNQRNIQYKQPLNYQDQLKQAKQKAYQDEYIKDSKNKGNKVKHKKSFNDYLKGFISIMLVLAILILIWQIPFVHNYFIKLYEENDIIHILVDIFIHLFQ